MIPIIESPVNDELFTSWMDYIMKQNGATESDTQSGFMASMIGPIANNIKDFRNRRYIPNVEDICKTEQESFAFPNLGEILEKQTDIYALLPFMTKGEQAKRMEYCFHGYDCGPNLLEKYARTPGLKICPECMKEDLKKYGRRIVHLPHQLYIDVCPIHGCILQDEKTGLPVKEESVTNQDMEKASFIYDLYTDPVLTDFDRTYQCIKDKLQEHNLTRKEASQRAAAEGYISKELMNVYYLRIPLAEVNAGFYETYIGILTWLFKTAANFRNCVEIRNVKGEYSRSDFDVLESNGFLTKFRCRTCGNVFYMNPVAAEYGTQCPECAQHMSKIQIYQRYANYLDDGEYEITEENGKLNIIHVECGKELKGHFFTNVWNHTKCNFCYERRTKHITKRGYKKHPRIGEENINRSGFKMRITAYRGCHDIDVTFGQGMDVKHKQYTNFKRGLIKCPKPNPEKVNSRLGEVGINKRGLKMTIIMYRNADDIDIEFESGAVTRHKSYDNFKRGRVKCPDETDIKR